MRKGNGECLSLEMEMDSVDFENGKWRVPIMRTGKGECLL
jgi:hypothetical protein